MIESVKRRSKEIERLMRKIYYERVMERGFDVVLDEKGKKVKKEEDV